MELVRCLSSVFIIISWIYIVYGQDCTRQASDGDAWIEISRELYQCQGRCTQLVGVFCTSDVTIVQLWTASADKWTLVWDYEWKPKKIGEIEHLDLVEAAQFVITPQHRLGVTTLPGQDDGAISVRKIFNDSMIQLRSSQDPGPFQLGSSYGFDDVLHPGTFLVNVCDSRGCPTLTVPPISPPPDICKMVSSDDRLIKLEKLRQLRTGVVKAIRTYFCDQNDVSVQLWEPDVSNADNYTLIWQKTLRPITTNGELVIIPLSPSEFIDIESSYSVALQPVGTSMISVPYQFSGSSANLITSSSNTATTCKSMIFQGLAYPSQFLLEFCYDAECIQNSGDTSISPRTPCSPQEDMSTTLPTDEVTDNSQHTDVSTHDTGGGAIGAASSMTYNSILTYNSIMSTCRYMLVFSIVFLIL